jgi:hypothetical protein
VKVGSSEAALLTKLNIRPFSYGLGIDCIFDNGSQFSVAVLDIDETMLISKFSFALSAVAALSLQIGYPTQASIPHSIGNAFRSLIPSRKLSHTRPSLPTLVPLPPPLLLPQLVLPQLLLPLWLPLLKRRLMLLMEVWTCSEEVRRPETIRLLTHAYLSTSLYV